MQESAQSHPVPASTIPQSQQQDARRNTQMTSETTKAQQLADNLIDVKKGFQRLFTNQFKMQETNVKMAKFVNDRLHQELRVFQIEYG